MYLHRREFLAVSAATGAAFAVPAVWAQPAAVAAKKYRVALSGCGWYGTSDLLRLIQVAPVEVVGLCDPDTKQLTTTSGLVCQRQKLSQGPPVFGDYRQMLKACRPDIVLVATPDHWHALQMIAAVEAGADVYVQKPISTDVLEGEAMVAAARKHDRVVQVGQQQRNGKDWAQMAEYLHSGALGKVAKVDIWGNFLYAAGMPPMPDTEAPADLDYDMWLGPAPKRPFNEGRWNRYWRMYWSYGGGLMSDWGVHLLDMGLWGLDKTVMPKSTVARGGKYLRPDYASETFDTMNVCYDFGDCLMNWYQCAGTETGFYDRNYGLAFKGVNGTLVANRAGWEVIPEKDEAEGKEKKNKVEPPQKVKGDNNAADRDHCRQFVEKAKAHQFDTACTVERGSYCAKIAHIGNIAALTGKALVYDDAKAKFDDAEANKYLAPAYRAPWKLPNL